MPTQDELLLDALRGRLSARALAVLEATGARFDLGSRCDPSELSQTLSSHGSSSTPEIERAEAALGGLQFDGDDPYRFGVFSMLVARDRRDPWMLAVDVEQCPEDDSRLVPFALGGGSDARHLIGGDGRIWFFDLLCMQQPTPQADNAGVFVERVLRTCSPVRSSHPHSLRVWAHLGKDLASAIGVPFVREASDSLERVWESEDHLITETPDWQFLIDPIDPDQEAPEPIMDIRSRTEDLRERVLDVLKEIAPDVRYDAAR